MRSFLRHLAGIAAFAAAVSSAAPAYAGYTSMVVFGDSLSDTGNVFLASGGTVPTSPYFNGRFSNGPVWIDHLASGLGLPGGAVPSLAGGSNYAFGGARTSGSAPVPGLLPQIGGLWAPAHPLGADPNGLYVVVGGGNDLRDARTAADPQAAVVAAYQNLANAVGFLATAGARNILIANVPDLGATPEAVALGLQAESTAVTLSFNTLVGTIEGALEPLFAELDIDLLDLFGIGAAIRDDALNNGGAVYGITNVFTPCAPFPGNIGISCDVSLFSDALHPSARAHALLGEAALVALRTQAVPEPATPLLLALALVALAGIRRRIAAA